MKLFDTHTHLNDSQFSDILDDVVARARAADVEQMIVVGTDLPSSRRAVAVANQFDDVFAAVGIQPNYCAEVTEEDWKEVVSLADEPSVVAIGETGLDRYWDYCPIERQRVFFHRHIEFSRERELPFIVHMRDCNADILDVFAAEVSRGPLHGVMHSFTGDWEMAKTCLAHGLYISFAGMVTFKKSTELRDVARLVPSDRLLLETDCPYLSPHPKRGQRPNEPGLIRHTAECLAEVRGESLEGLARQTTENAQRLFGLN